MEISKTIPGTISEEIIVRISERVCGTFTKEFFKEIFGGTFAFV